MSTNADVYLPLDGSFMERSVAPVVSGVCVRPVVEQQSHHLRGGEGEERGGRGGRRRGKKIKKRRGKKRRKHEAKREEKNDEKGGEEMSNERR